MCLFLVPCFFALFTCQHGIATCPAFSTSKIQTSLLIDAAYQPIAAIHGNLAYDDIYKLPTALKRARWRPPFEESVFEKKVTTCELYALHTTAKFGRAVHRSLCYPQNAFFTKPEGWFWAPLCVFYFYGITRSLWNSCKGEHMQSCKCFLSHLLNKWEIICCLS